MLSWGRITWAKISVASILGKGRWVKRLFVLVKILKMDSYTNSTKQQPLKDGFNLRYIDIAKTANWIASIENFVVILEMCKNLWRSSGSVRFITEIPFLIITFNRAFYHSKYSMHAGRSLKYITPAPAIGIVDGTAIFYTNEVIKSICWRSCQFGAASVGISFYRYAFTGIAPLQAYLKLQL